MLSKMAFLPRLADFLRKHNAIYTLREYKYSTRLCRVSNVGVCRRILVGEFVLSELSAKDLSTTVSQSGFSDETSWLKALYSFVNNPSTVVFMYKVEVV